MRGYPIAAAWLACSACSGSSAEPSMAASNASSEASDNGTRNDTLPLRPGAATTAPSEPTVPAEPTLPAEPSVPAAEASPYVAFVDSSTGFRTDEVFDADREIVHFDADLQAMIAADSGTSVGGWTVDGADLDWSRSGVAFRVRFGTEDGERRAYFTEAGPGTICNLDVAGTDVLFISATSETPPNP